MPEADVSHPYRYGYGYAYYDPCLNLMTWLFCLSLLAPGPGGIAETASDELPSLAEMRIDRV